MRNPLSAIVHCADAITSSLDDADITHMPIECLEALKDNIQSAKVILQCANHQKRIIDDILTLSKLDSMLLSITPVAVKIPKLVDSIVNIFEAEMKSHGILYHVQSDKSLKDLDISRLYLGGPFLALTEIWKANIARPISSNPSLHQPPDKRHQIRQAIETPPHLNTLRRQPLQTPRLLPR